MNAHANQPSANRFHNWSNEQLADAIGHKDNETKAHIASLEELKAEAKRRGIESATGSVYKITITPVESSRLDTKALRELLGDALDPYYKPSVAATLRITSLFQQPELVG